MINVAKNASNKLNGIAIGKSPNGNTPIFPITNYINTKPTNQEKSVVLSNVNFFDIIKIEMAKSSDHIPHTAPFIGSAGKVSPSDL